MRLLCCLAVATALVLGGCRDRDKSEKLLDTTTSGSIKIAVDESLKPLLAAEVDAFQGIYKDAHIEAIYTSESDAIQLMLKDSVRLAVVTRKLTPDEQAELDKVKIQGRQMTVAKDGIALILHNDNRDTLFSWNQVHEIFEGKISKWDQINPSSGTAGIEIVFDHPNSGILRYLRDTLKNVTTIPSNFFAVESNEAVIDYVSKKKNAIGLIGVAWVSDAEDSTANHFLKSVRVAGISLKEDYHQPYQAYIAQKLYPLTREVVVISREARSGLGSGFLTFVASDKGQRVVLKAGLVPATMPVRIVEITYDQN
ncbi:MAG: substrate-binding domain-containing protein [Cyclobacteriaceae bacterium]